MKYFSFILLFFFITPAFAEEVRYIHATNAKLHADPHFNAEVLGTFKRGHEVTVLEKQKRWLKVRHGDQEGWVSKLLAKKNPPLRKTSILENDEVDLSQNSRRRASVNNTTAAARGLREDARARDSDDMNSDYHSLSEMETNKVSDQEAMEFLNAK